ncbi:hypothetical protein BDQ17DRAFT_1353386 [Cyathus striatus]|nr:hypothetical protein BDQ17DRAFT_1353386 [Cyathus striatus]
MKMGNKDAYICLIPKAPETPAFPEEHEAEADITPARSWSLLQPLTGTCLYHRQGWFTYSYCHNEEIRQFKELIPSHARAPGAYTPEEDPEWESYTLGRAPMVPEPGADLTLAERNAQAANLELARNAGSRYLVQRWGDGTICDKTGKPREVEVQFHCSMTMTDNILFVKEAKTCSYVLVINTPRLCGEPGFKSRRDSGEEALIRCREIVDSPTQAESGLPITDYPLKFPPRKPVLPSSQQVPLPDPKKEKLYKDIVKQTFEALAKQENLDKRAAAELIIEFGDDPIPDLDREEAATRVVEALRAVGYDVTAQKKTVKGTTDNVRDKEKGNVKNTNSPGEEKVDSTKDRNGDVKSKLKKFVDNFNHGDEL